jgi:hypothetical protein
MSSQGRPLTLLRIKYPFHFRVCCAAILLALVSAWVPGIVALAGDCDGTAGNDVVNCTSDPAVPDDVAGLGLGDDTYTQDSGVLAEPFNIGVCGFLLPSA